MNTTTYNHNQIVNHAVAIIETGSMNFEDAELARLVKLELQACGYEPESREENDFTTTITLENIQ